MIMEGVKRNCQFIIATHSPVIMALPNAKIYEISNERIYQVDYQDIESVNLLKQLLNYPETFFRHFY